KNYNKAKEFAINNGAYGFTISGAGTSVIAITSKNENILLNGIKKILNTETGFLLKASKGFEYKIQ
ncbi:MAG: hypothetical protein NZ870_02885, partial [bacterium]|nr:hypothetical protein [bacterium]